MNEQDNKPNIKKSFYDKVKERNVKRKEKREKRKTDLKLKAEKIEEEQEKIQNVEKTVEEENEPKGLNEKVDDVREQLKLITSNYVKKKKDKRFKLPGKIRRQVKKAALKNKVFVILLKTNRTIKLLITKERNGFIIIDGKIHNSSLDFHFLWKGKFPTLIIKEWDLDPVGTKDYYEALAEGRSAEPVATTIRMVEEGELLTKKGFGSKAWIFIALGIIAFLYVLFASG